MAKKAIPLAPSKQIAGGSKFDDIDVEIVDIKFALFGYPNKEGVDTVSPGVPTLAVTYEPTETPGDENRFTDHHSVGNGKNVEPSEDGEQLVPVDEDKEYDGLTNNSRGGFYLAKLVEAGFPEAAFSADKISVVKGVKGHYRRIDPPKSGFGKDDKKIGVISKVNELPNGKAAGKATGAGSSKAEETAVLLITKILEKSAGPVAKVKLGQIANKSLEGKPELKVEVVKLVLEDKFLNRDGQPWTYNGREVSKKAAEEQAGATDDLTVDVAA